MLARKRLSWPFTAMALAKTIAESRSEDPYVQVGACGIKIDNSIILGYNGPPSGIELDWSDRDRRRDYILHAESNLLDLTKPGELKLLAVTHLPCPECLKRIAKHKIKEVYYESSDYKSVNQEKTQQMADFLDIKLIKLII